MAVIEDTRGSGDETPLTRALRYRLHQQSILSDFGIEALRAHDLGRMLDRAAELCALGMRTPFGKYLEICPGRQVLLVRAGVGWDDGVVGQTELGTDTGSPAGFAFQTGEAVISNHLEAEERFRTPGFMAEHGIRRAINVLVEASGEKFGVLEVDSADEGQFEEADLAFMRGFANLIGVAIERHHARERLNEAVEHQELLTREASHRVKNSLAMVSAMLTLQMQDQDSAEVERSLGDARARVAAIAQAHDRLWSGTQVGMVDLADLLNGIVDDLTSQADSHVTCDVPSLQLKADVAIPLGLIVTELVTNAVKYAGDSEIGVRLTANSSHAALEVTDRGPGLPEGYDPTREARSSLGMRMVHSLVRQLDGSIAFTPAHKGADCPGTRAVVRLSLSDEGRAD